MSVVNSTVDSETLHAGAAGQARCHTEEDVCMVRQPAMLGRAGVVGAVQTQPEGHAGRPPHSASHRLQGVLSPQHSS